MHPTDYIFWGTVISAAVTIGLAYWSREHQRRSTLKQDTILENTTATVGATTSTEAKVDSLLIENAALKLRNDKLQKRLEEKTKWIFDELTGGGDLPILEVHVSELRYEKAIDKYLYNVDFFVASDGKYNLKNLSATISDVTTFSVMKEGIYFWADGSSSAGWRKTNEEDLRNFKPYRKYDFGFLPAGSSGTRFHLSTWSPGLIPFAAYTVVFNWNGGELRCHITFEIHDEKPVVEFRYLSLNGQLCTDESRLKVHIQ